jgi:hypothetical protein
MNQKNYIDELFRRGLESHASETPVQLWEEIARRRNTRHRLWVLWRRNLPYALALFSLLLVGVLVWYVAPKQQIGAPIASQAEAVAKSTKVERAKKTLPSLVDNPQTVIAQEAKVTRLSSRSVRQIIDGQNIINSNYLYNNKDNIQKERTNTAATSKAATKTERPEPALEGKTSQASPKAVELLQGILPTVVLNEVPPQLGPDPCPKLSNTRDFHLDLEVLVSADNALRHLSPKNSDSAAEYAAARNETELPRQSFSTGLRVSAHFPNRLVLRTGINYSQINELFRYANEHWTQTTINETVLPDGTVVSDTTVLSGLRVLNSYNQYRTLDVPVMLGYEIPLQRFVFSLNGGAYFNLMFSPQGRMLSPDGTPVGFGSNADSAYPAFVDKFGTSLYGSFGINYYLNQRLAFMVEPHVKHQLRAITRPDYPLEQRFTTFGIHAGLRVRL